MQNDEELKEIIFHKKVNDSYTEYTIVHVLITTCDKETIERFGLYRQNWYFLPKVKLVPAEIASKLASLLSRFELEKTARAFFKSKDELISANEFIIKDIIE